MHLVSKEKGSGKPYPVLRCHICNPPQIINDIHCFKMADGAIGEGDGVEGQPSGAVSLGQQSPKSLL